MEIKKVVGIMVWILLGISALLFILYIIGRKTSQKSVNDHIIRHENRHKKLYYRLVKWPLIGRYLRRIENYVEMIELSDRQTIARKTLKISGVAIGGTILLWMLLILLDHDFRFVIIATIIVYMIHEEILRYMIERLETRLLSQFLKFLSEVRHHYNEHQMIDEAIYDAIQNSDYEMARHGSKMHDVLSKEEADIEAYYETAPNRYFKSFMALAYTVIRYGDQRIDETSSFLKNMNFLKQEISLALLQKQKLNYLLSSLTFICVIPIFLVKPLENWATKSMPELMNYYEGTYGFVVQIILFILILLSYQIIIRIRNREEVMERIQRKQWHLILKVKIIREIIRQHITVHYSKAKKLERTLKMVGSRNSVEELYGKQIECGLIVFICGLILLIGFHNVERTMILEPIYIPESKEASEELAQYQFDQSFVLTYASEDEVEIKEQLKEGLQTTDDVLIEINYERIISKIISYENTELMWFELLGLLITAGVFGFLPRMMLAFRKQVMNMQMEDEVLQFHTIILMLMYIERMSVCDLLEWMSLFAIIFKEDIEQCLNDMELGDYEALEALKLRVTYPPFIRIIDNLEATANKITIKEAFDELLVERGFYQEKRKQDMEIMINKKGAWGRIVAFIPMVATIFLFLLVPFTHLGLNQYAYYISELGGGL